MNQTVSLPVFVPFTEADIRRALEDIRQMKSLRNSPLHDTAWVLSHALDRHIEGAGVPRDVLLSDLVIGHIIDRYGALRIQHGWSHPGAGYDPVELQADFQSGNIDLMRWSLLYHHYVLTAPRLSLAELSEAVGFSERTMRRTMVTAIRQVAQDIVHLEGHARQTHRRDWLAQRLPPGRPALYGRDADLQMIRDTWEQGGYGITLLTGMRGIGKTALMVACCRQLLDANQIEELIWIDGGSISPSGWLAAAVQTLGMPPSHQAFGLPMQISTVVGRRRVLAVVDDVSLSDESVRELDRLAGLLPGGHVFVTARNHPLSRVSWEVLTLPPLDERSAHVLLDDMLPKQAHQITSSARGDIVRHAGGNPLLLSLLAQRALMLPLDRALTLSDTFEHVDQDLLIDTWDMLSEHTHRLLAVLTRTYPQPLSWRTLYEQLPLAPAEVDQALLEAGRWHLIREMQPGGPYRLKTAMAPFIHQRVSPQPEPPMLTTSANLLRIAQPIKQRGDWATWRNVLEASLPADTCDHDPAVLVELGIAYRWLGEHQTSERTLHTAIEKYGDQGDFKAQATALMELGALQEELSHTDEALATYQHAANIAGRYDDRQVQVRALRGVASVYLIQQQMAQAIEVLRQAMELIDDDEPDGALVSLMGMAHLRAGAIDEAIQYHLRAIDLLEAAGDHPRLARARLRLGIAYLTGGSYGDAATQLRVAVQWMQMMGDVRGVARGLANLGAAEQTQGQIELALDLWRSALDLQTQLSDGLGLAYTCYNLGDLLWHLNRPADATRYLSCALRYARQLALDALVPHLTTHPLYPDLVVSEETPCPPLM